MMWCIGWLVSASVLNILGLRPTWLQATDIGVSIALMVVAPLERDQFITQLQARLFCRDQQR